MRTADASRILREVAALMGQQLDDVSGEEFPMLRTFMDERLRIAWEMEAWPPLVLVEKRYFRELYDNGKTYASGDQVYYPAEEEYYQAIRGTTGNKPTDEAFWAEAEREYSADDYDATTTYSPGDQVYYPDTDKHYQCHTESTGNDPTDTSFWGELIPFERYVAFEQTGETKIGEVFGVTKEDPENTTQVEKVRYIITDLGVTVWEDEPYVYLRFRKRPPELVGDTFDSSKAYSSGDQVYFANSSGVANFYEANQSTSAGESPESASAKWDVVEIPYIFRGYLVRGMVADYLKMDGQFSKAQAQENQANSFLEFEADKLWRQQGQPARMTFEMPQRAR